MTTGGNFIIREWVWTAEEPLAFTCCYPPLLSLALWGRRYDHGGLTYCCSIRGVFLFDVCTVFLRENHEMFDYQAYMKMWEGEV